MSVNRRPSLEGSRQVKRKDESQRQHVNNKFIGQGVLLCGLTLCSLTVIADSTLEQLKSFSLVKLANLEVSIASKTPRKASQIAAAITVLTADDIRNSLATTIPDVLRLVPGLQVARIDAHNSMVSSRGFGARSTNKLLVMIDGRSIYSPLYGGVYWDQHDVVLDDIERIEVIRGPGASVWGANAVNGVINIITRSALDSQSATIVSATAGSEISYTSLRTSGAMPQNGAYRAYAKYRIHDDAAYHGGSKADDGWDDWRTGFRMDWQGDNDSHLTLQGDMHRGDLSERISVLDLASPSSQLITDDVDTWGHNILARWSTTLSGGGRSELQAYYDKQQRDQWVIEETTTTYDINYNYQLPRLARHDIIVGGGYRYVDNELSDSDVSIGQARLLTPAQRDDELFSFFAQDEIEVLSETLWLTLGVKLESNDYSGVETQPNIRLRWALSEEHMLWSAVSKAVRTPTRAEHDSFIVLDIISTGPPPLALTFQGNSDFDSEELIAWELGYRFLGSDTLSFDLSLFFNDYDDLRSVESLGFIPVQLTAPSSFAIQTTPTNGLSAKSHGLEMSVAWRPFKQWQVNLNYAYLDIRMHVKSSSNDAFADSTEGLSPENQLTVSSYYKIKSNVQLNLIGRYVDDLPSNHTDAYFELDAGLEWQLKPRLALSFVGRNLIDAEHKETSDTSLATEETLVQREFYLKLDWQL